MKKTLLTLLTLILTVVIGAQVANAIGSLSPSGTAGTSTQYTLNDIYTKLTANTSTSTKSGLISTPGSVTATFRTLTEIYFSIPTIDATKVAAGTSYMGVMGTKQNGVVYPTEWSADHPSGPVDWATAMSYCDSLTENSHTDWRLPTYIELVNAYLTNNPIFEWNFYWTSTEASFDTGLAYAVYMYEGGASILDLKTNLNYLSRCTR